MGNFLTLPVPKDPLISNPNPLKTLTPATTPHALSASATSMSVRLKSSGSRLTRIGSSGSLRIYTPALSRNIEGPCEEKQDMGVPARAIAGFGFHDVVIENPVHSVHLCDMEARDIGQVLLAYKKRIQQIASVESIKYVQVFKNHGASAGASMSHSHSQLLALPIIPSAVSARFEGMNEYFKKTGKCSLCEVQAKELLIDESTHFISIVPFAATYPFEMWIIPRAHSSHFHEFDCDKMVELGGLLKLMLRKMSLQLNNPPFNFMIQTSPLQVKESELSLCSLVFTDSTSVEWRRGI
ncbi:hypothetical protein OIU78_022427 [Salix suchowensis]|nr:hypothetical protein OIU78_022427 [Salix suchowensis]